MKVYTFEREMLIPVSVNEAWSFFSDPCNLKTITPLDLNFKILSKNLPEKVYSGLLIDYFVSPFPGIKTRWVTEIKEVNEPYFFIDEQKEGSYALWKHKHSFEKTADGTLMKDEIEYSIPFSVLGIIAHALFVKRKIKNIFDYRSKIISELFLPDNISAA